MNEKKKGFNLFPEYVWMIFVGMLLAIIILTNVIPGHAANMYPLSPDDMGYGANYVSHITVKGSELYVGGTYIANVGQILQESEDRISKFESDADAALASFFAQIPKDQIYFGIADDSGYGSVLNWLRSFLDDRDIQYSEIIIDYDNPFWYPQLWPDDWRDDYSQSIYSLGPYSVNVYVRKNLISPSGTPTPTPVPRLESVLVYAYPRYGPSAFSSAGYYLIDFNIALEDTVSVSPEGNDAYSYAVSNYGVSSPWTNNVLLYFANSSYGNAVFYLKGVASSVTSYFLGSSLISTDYDVLRSNYSGVSFVGNTYSFWRSDRGITSLSLYFNGSSAFNLVSATFPFANQDVSGTLEPGGNLGIFEYSSNQPSYRPIIQAYRFGLTGASGVTPGGATPTPGPTATPEPLPTSGESIHVILPSGTPTPTPPFSVPGGSDGGIGSDSPGSIGSGLSSQQTSGILEYWSSFVADNPAMLFLTSTFQSLPSELLYPLYILLFILLLLAVIRLFVHFSGG